MEELESAWGRLLAALGDEVDRLELLPGATRAQIAAAEAIVGPLPAEYRALVALANGQVCDGERCVSALSILPNGNWFASLDRVVAQWQFERGFDLDDYDIPHTQDRERIRSFAGHPKRLTIAGNAYFDQDNTFLDGVPGPAGTTWQLVQWCNEADMALIGTSLADYLDRVAAAVEDKTLVAGRDDEVRMLVLGETGLPGWAYVVRGDKPPRRRR